MIYTWCSLCASRVCLTENSHRAQKGINYRADFMLGGRYGKRIRKLFPNKKDAEAYEYITQADFKRGTFLPVVRSKTNLGEFIEAYIEKRAKVYMKGFREEEYRFRSFKDMFKERLLHSINLNDWDQYVQKRLSKNISKTTLNRELTAFKCMFKWGVKNSYLKINPFSDAVKFKENIVKVRWLNDAEIENVLTRCTELKDLELRDILVVALNTGFRKANLLQLTSNDITNQRIEAKKTKSGKSYQVPINQELANVLQRLISSHSAGPLLNFQNFRKRFSNLINDPSITLHTFRHTFAAQCLKRGIPIDRVCAWMGHHSVEFTRAHYGHLCPNQEAIEINLLNLGKTLAPSTSLLGNRVVESSGDLI